MTQCFLALGSNLKSPVRQLRCAIHHLRRTSGIAVQQTSSFYHTPPMSRNWQPQYCNAVVLIITQLTPNQLLETCQHIEMKHGRVRKHRHGARSLDIDILTYGGKILSTPKLTLPHPGTFERDFVLVPLFELLDELRGSVFQ